MLTLTIPQRRDPIARGALFTMIAVVTWALVAQPGISADAKSDAEDSALGSILIATATPALPTPALPTPEPAGQVIGLTPPTPAGQQGGQSDEPEPTVDNSQYLENVGAQAPHSPRGDVPDPAPAFVGGPVLYKDQDGNPVFIAPIDGLPQPTAAPQPTGYAVAMPAPSDERLEIIGDQESNQCKPGEKFYPRSGCHLPGSSGPMPGAVNQP